MITDLIPVAQLTPPVTLTAAQFHTLAEIPPELEWFANLTNPNTRRAYRQDIADFQAFGHPAAGAVLRRHPRPRHRLAGPAHQAGLGL